MKCEELLAALNDYVDGEVDPGICDAFRAHFDGCNPCQLVVDSIRKTITLYKHGQPVELPPELHQHLCQMLKKRWQAHFGCVQG